MTLALHKDKVSKLFMGRPLARNTQYAVFVKNVVAMW